MQPAQPGSAVHFDPDEVRDYFDRPIVFATVRVAMGDDRRPAEPAVIVRILTHLGLPARAPPRSPARPLALFQAA